MRTAWRRERIFWRGLWTASPGLTLACAALVVLTAVAFYVAILASAQLVAAIAHHQPSHQAWQWLTITVVALVVQPIAANALNACSAAHQAAVTADQHRRVAALANSPHGIGHLEDPATSGPLTGLLHELRGNFGLWCIGEVWRSLLFRSQGIAAIVVLIHWSWIAAVALAAVQFALARTFGHYIYVVQSDLIDLSSTDGRPADYFAQLPTRRTAGKEVRLFGLTDWCLTSYRTAWQTAHVGVVERRNRALRPTLIAGIVLLATTVAVAVWLLHGAWAGVVSTATLTATLQAIMAMVGFGPLGDTSVQAARARTYAERLATLEGDRPAVPAIAHTDLDGRAAAIDLDDVSFSYPTRETPVFQDLSLHIPAGQSVAIVGVNGVGKSTLIKLLAGLYPPDRGTVRINGADPFLDDSVRRQVAVIFQDFVRYHLSLRDNVLLPVSTSATNDPDQTAQKALHAAAAEDVLQRVGDWDTTLDPGYAGGTDLSGGQWQRVALARAFAAVAAGAGVLVLDEPTAALDVRVEAEIFSRFLESTRGVTSILVSHRLSSVRHAERIVVLGPRGVVEDGSHEQLMELGGQYAQMFTLQATRFQQAGAIEGAR